MYKRVPRNKPAHMKHLDDPIIEYIHLYRIDQEHFLSNLPKGRYIVCADYKIGGVVVQHNCFETYIDRPDTNGENQEKNNIQKQTIFCFQNCKEELLVS